MVIEFLEEIPLARLSPFHIGKNNLHWTVKKIRNDNLLVEVDNKNIPKILSKWKLFTTWNRKLIQMKSLTSQKELSETGNYL